MYKCTHIGTLTKFVELYEPEKYDMRTPDEFPHFGLLIVVTHG